MQSFKDSQGRAWNVRLTVAEAERLADSKAGFNLYDVTADGLKIFGRLSDDYVLMGKCLWVLVEPQAKAQQVDRQGFLSALGGDVLAEAMHAWLGALWDFFPNPRRDELKRLAGALEAAKVLDLKTAAVGPPATTMVKTSENTSGKSPDNSDSTPAPSPSAS